VTSSFSSEDDSDAFHGGVPLQFAGDNCDFSVLEHSATRQPVEGHYAPIVASMCRNITPLRGLEPEATREEIEAAALQYVRKVGGLRAPSKTTSDAVETAVRKVAEATAELLVALPPARKPPPVSPPLRRRLAVVK